MIRNHKVQISNSLPTGRQANIKGISKFRNEILKRVQNDMFVMPNQVLNLLQDLRFRHLI